MDLMNLVEMNDIQLYLGIAFLISEALAMIPALKSNSIIQLLLNILSVFKPNK